MLIIGFFLQKCCFTYFTSSLLKKSCSSIQTKGITMKSILSSTTTSASKFLKNVILLLSSMTRTKSLAIRHKINGLQARLIVLSLLRNKKFSLGSIAHKIEAILHHKHEDAEVVNEEGDQSKAILHYNASVPSHDQYLEYYNDYENENEDKYPDMRHSLFDDEMDLGDPNGSVIDLVKNSKDEGED